MTTTPKEGASAPSIEPAKNPCRLPQPETADQRRERLARAISDAAGEGWALPWEETDEINKEMAGKAADAIIASDRAAGCDPEEMRTWSTQMERRYQGSLSDLKKAKATIVERRNQRDEALAERDARSAGGDEGGA